jgi:hypothetical protein
MENSSCASEQLEQAETESRRLADPAEQCSGHIQLLSDTKAPGEAGLIEPEAPALADENAADYGLHVLDREAVLGATTL